MNPRMMAKTIMMKKKERNEPSLSLHKNPGMNPEPALKEEDNNFHEDAKAMAKHIMHKRTVSREKSNMSEQNYAKGGNVQTDGPMLGTDEDDDEELDMHQDSNSMDDDFLSYDMKPSLHDESMEDNEEYDSGMDKDASNKKRLKKLLG